MVSNDGFLDGPDCRVRYGQPHMAGNDIAKSFDAKGFLADMALLHRIDSGVLPDWRGKYNLGRYKRYHRVSTSKYYCYYSPPKWA